MTTRLYTVAFGIVAAFAGMPSFAAEPQAAAFTALGSEYQEQIRPLLGQYCLDCHSTAAKEGELDLERFARIEDVRAGTHAWLKVAEMLDNAEMPPKDEPQPTATERKQLRGWVDRYLHAEAQANAGDPGPVVLRRLSNAEYTFTIRDLTGVSLDPAREFPADGAAGEGFTNAGAALAMSPALLTKYIDAAKEISRHAVLLPDGFRFSASSSRSDWTNEILAEIRELYRRHTDASGASKVNLQGIVFDTNEGGRLPIEKYLAAVVDERTALTSGEKSIDAVARSRSLNAKYLGILWNSLTSDHQSLVLDAIRSRWRNTQPAASAALVEEIARWQQMLWRFNSVGHIGKVGGPRMWQEPLTPLVSRQEVRQKLSPPSDSQTIKLYLAAGDAGDGNDQDYVVWEKPRLVSPAGRELSLRDARAACRNLIEARERMIASAAKCLAAAEEIQAAESAVDVGQIAARHGVEPAALAAWLEYLGLDASAPVRIESHFQQKLTSLSGYEFVKGWGATETPSVVANSSDQHVRIPGNLRSHSLAVHPSPTLQVAIGWTSPIAAALRVEATVQHAHPECGNGVTWALELLRGSTRRRLQTGVAQGAAAVRVGPIEGLAVKPGDLIALVVGPRDGNHSCDLTAVDLTLTGEGRRWDLASDVSADILAGNPHADGQGNAAVWHFFTEPISSDAGLTVPPGSLIAKWQAAENREEKARLAIEIEAMLRGGSAPAKDSPDAALYRQLASLNGPLVQSAARLGGASDSSAEDHDKSSAWGLDPALFGEHPQGGAVDSDSLCVKAPAVIECALPADLVDGWQFVASGRLHAETAAEGSVQLQVLTALPEQAAGLRPSAAVETNVGGAWTSNNRQISHAAPILVNDGSQARRRLEAAFADFRDVFPIAVCYPKIVPVDEVVTLTLFYREDDHLRRLMLDDAETARLDRLWQELHFVSQDALTLVDAFQQLLEYASQDADPKVFEPLRGPINERAAAFRNELVAAEPKQLAQLVEFAARAYRRPLTEREAEELRALYKKLRDEELPHDDALRFTLARVLVSPAFLYRLEASMPAASAASDSGAAASHPVSDWELATRLSYFLWSSAPDDELRATAAAGTLHEPQVLAAQTERMLRDPRVRRLATQFACQWLQIYEFDALDEKSQRHFPEFAELRGDMYEEAIRFFSDAFQRDLSVLDLFDSDHTFVNQRLAKFYGVSNSGSAEAADDWRRVDGIRQQGRGGILGLAATLAKQSGASRTSPILRGNWVSEVLLGEKLPKPPPGVPQLPEDEAATDGLTVRQLVEKHASNAQCAKCHVRIDPLGFALEEFDAIGRRRDKDLASRPIDSKTTLPDGAQVAGLAGLRDYLIHTRREAIVRQFCRKLLGFALGRSIQLSDEPLLTEMQQNLAKHDDRLSAAIQTMVLSNQFRALRASNTVGQTQ